jgi:hypothetical protein
MRTRALRNPASIVRSVAVSTIVLFGLDACASTTYDSSVTEAPAVETTTTLPAGSAAELLPRLVAEIGLLSNIIGTGGAKTEQLASITNLFDAVRPELADTDGVATIAFDGAIELCRKGTTFNRPADADKCFRNVKALTDSYLANNP